MIYLDSSALLKLVFAEDESDALASWLATQPAAGIVSSELARVEVLRSCRRVDVGSLSTGRSLLESLDLIPLSAHLLQDAVEVGSDALRSLDAIHLASALSLGGALSAVVVYNHRLEAAAKDSGLVVLSPGVDRDETPRP